MKNRLHCACQPFWLLAVFFLFFHHLDIHAQCGDNTSDDFIFSYSGDGVLFIDENCDQILDFGLTAPGVEMQDPTDTLTAFSINENLTGFAMGEVVDDNIDMLDVFFVAEGKIDMGMTIVRDTFCVQVTFADSLAPVFTITPNANGNISCVMVVPPDSLEAIDNCDGVMLIPPQDNIIIPFDGCDNGQLVRTWTATDNTGNASTVSQTITLTPDSSPPDFNYTPRSDTVDCDESAFMVWLMTELDSIQTNATDNCSDTIFVTHDADVMSVQCNAPNLVEFTITDECGNAASMSATFLVRDEEAPVIQNVPASLTLNCEDPVPDAPMLMATDNCSTIDEVVLTETTTTTGSGACAAYNYVISRTWTAVDDCGNIGVGTQTITVQDITPPDFIVPMDTTFFSCVDISDTSITGDVATGSGSTVIGSGSGSNAMDNCSPSDMLDVSFADDTISMECNHRYVVERTWAVADECGNTNMQIQTITVRDTTPPSFIVPPAATASCGELNNTALTGEPTLVQDNCDDNPDVSFTDVFTQGSCANGGTIERQWTVTDECGNASTQSQTIIFTDDEAPTFNPPASDMDVGCSDTLSIEAAFDAWIAANGNAIAMDNCTPDTLLTWLAYNTGTDDPASLPDPDCPNDMGIYQQQTVDFIVQDECGNRDTTTATFTAVDLEPPTLVGCHQDTVIYVNDPNECSAFYRVFPLPVSDECGVSTMPFNSNFKTYNVVSDDPGNQEVPVDTINVNFFAPVPPLFANGNAELTIMLNNVDAEEPTEFYRIYGEDGTLLGQTNPTTAQCDSSVTILNNITPSQISAWAIDSRIKFKLIPNTVDQGGEFSINDICLGGEVALRLRYDLTNPTGVDYDMSINGGPRFGFPFPAYPTDLGVGDNTISLFVTDCSGNTDSCTFAVTVIDTFPPTLVCNGNQTLPIDEGNCTAAFTVPLPEIITDNCAVGVQYSQTQPATLEESYISFSQHPNLTGFLADDKTFTFTGVGANATADVELEIAIQADIDDNSEFFDIIGEDGTDLGQTFATGGCDTMVTRIITIPEDLFNDWAMDGSVTITAVSSHQNFPIPPGGDGIHPCNPSAVQMDGDVDSVSTIQITLLYEQHNPSFMATGATNIPLMTMMPPQVSPTFDFNVGTTIITYFIDDVNNNEGSCSDTITIIDNQAPTALCQGTTVFVNPSGTVPDTIMVSDIDNGSFDNCMIESSSVSPSIITCDRIEEDTILVTLTITDASGNSATCTAPVRVTGEKPQPTFFVSPCDADTLFLFANPPAAPGNIVYTYQWSGPNGFVSDLENPVIPFPDDDNAGSYTVNITGITGCESFGVVEVTIDDVPVSPVAEGPASICSNESLTLTTMALPGNNVTYTWYEGTPPNGIVVAEVSVPNLTIDMPSIGTHNYYVIITRNDCPSQASNVLTVQVSEVPIAVVNQNNITVCEGESIQLGTPVVGSGITYFWTGPGFSSDLQIPAPIENADADNAGVYTLVISRNGCESEPAFVAVNVLDAPDQPQITSNNSGEVCEGQELILRTNIQNANTYSWMSPSFETMVTDTSILIISQANLEDAGNWTVIVTQNGCDSPESEPTEVIVNPIPNLAVSADPNPACEGDNVQLQASPTLQGATYQWSGPNGFTSAAQNPMIESVQFTDSGIYTCTLTDENGCQNVLSINLVIEGGVTITGLSHDGQPCLSGPTDITFTSQVFPSDDGGYTYNWLNPQGLPVADDSTFTIEGATEADAGVYQLIVTNAAGCVSEAELIDLNVMDPPATPAAPSFNVSTQPPFCEGDIVILETTTYSGDDVTYRWHGPNGSVFVTETASLTINEAVPENSGMYSVDVFVGGCLSDASSSTNVTINPTPVAIVNSDMEVCEGETLTLSCEVVQGATYSWTGPGGFTSSVRNPIIPSLDPSTHTGTYICTVTLNDCESAPASTNIIVNEAPGLPIAMNNGPLCIDEPGTVLTLGVLFSSGTSGANYTWYDENFNQISASSPSLTFDITALQGYGEGTHSFFVEATKDGCSSGFSVPTEVTLNTIPDNEAFAGDDFDACENQTVTLTATPPSIGDGFWTQVAGPTEGVAIANPNQASTPVMGLIGGENYTFLWTLSNGACGNYDEDMVNVSVDIFETAFGGINIDTCEVTEVQLNADPAVSGLGEWTQTEAQAALGVIIVNPDDPNTEAIGLVPGNEYSFTWNITDNECGTSTDEVRIDVKAGIAFAGEDFNACGSGCLEINAANAEGVWSSEDPNIEFTDPNSPNTIVCGLQAGVNSVIWTIHGGVCGDRSEDELLITYEDGPIAVADEIIVPYGSAVDFDVDFNDIRTPEFSVEIIDGPSSGKLDTIENGFYTYTATVGFIGVDELTYELCSPGCECTTTTVTFFVGGEAACEAPSIITPNDDDWNDAFIVPCLDNPDKIINADFAVFNQWGDEVFRQANYKNDWKGTYDGQDLPVGTYFYVLTFDDGTAPLSGFVVIQR